MVIDGHVHIGKTEKSDRYFTFESYAEMAKYNVINGAVAIPNISNKDTTYDLNFNFLRDLSTFNSPDFKYYPFLLINPYENIVCQQISRHKKIIYGLKYHPSVHQVEISNSKLERFIEKAKIYNIPILVHCGRNSFSHIRHIIKAAHDNPDVNFIAAHLGGNASDLIEKALNLLYHHGDIKNIYLDTSAVKLPWLIELAVSLLGYDKIIFGSDEPYADLRISKYCLDLASIERKSSVYSKNILKLLKVDLNEDINSKSKSNT